MFGPAFEISSCYFISVDFNDQVCFLMNIFIYTCKSWWSNIDKMIIIFFWSFAENLRETFSEIQDLQTVKLYDQFKKKKFWNLSMG